MPMDMANWGPGMMAVMGVVSLVVLAAIITGIVLLVRAFSRSDLSSGSSPRAISILEERFARGEIDRDEYETNRRLLDKHAS